jgi:FxsC-like protein
MHLPDLPQVPHDVALVREAFEALGYTPVLPELANNPSASTVLRNIEAWSHSDSVRPPDVVVVYFASHAVIRSDSQAELMTFDREPSTRQASGITIPRLQRAFSDRLGGIMVILGTGSRIGNSTITMAHRKGPPLWVMSCLQDERERRKSNFARTLATTLQQLNHGSAPPKDLTEFSARIRKRMLPDRAEHGPVIQWWDSGASSAFHRFFPGSRRPRSAGIPPLPADIAPWFGQSSVLEAVMDWLLYQPDDDRPRIVTGPQASGKTTLLRFLERQLAQRRSRDADASSREQDDRGGTFLPVLLTAVPGTTDDMSRDLIRQLGFGKYAENSWIAQVASSPDMVLVLLDRLHEASPNQRRSIVDQVVRPLQQLPGVRFVIADDPTQLGDELGTDVEVLGLPDLPGGPRERVAAEDGRRQSRTALSRSAHSGIGHEPYFFLSYARRDNRDAFVERFYDDLVQELLRTGADPDLLPPFRDVERLTLGADWRRELGAAVGRCRAFVALYSPAYLNSEYCGKEWTAFRERLEEYRRETEIDVPALVPVLWAPLQGDLPEEIGRFQYQEAGMGEEYSTRGLMHILRTDPTGPAYRMAVERVAYQVRAVADRFRLPPAPGLDLGELRGLFPAASHQGAAAPKTGHVLVFVAAGVADALPEGRHRAEYYGRSPWEWTPYHPPRNPTIVHRVQRMIVQQGYTSSIETVDHGLSSRLDEAMENNQASILLVDPWAVRIPVYRDVLAEFDRRLHPTTGVLVPCHDVDEESGSEEIWEDLSRVLPRNWRRYNDPLFRVRVAEDEFDGQLAAMLDVAQNRLMDLKSNPSQLPEGPPPPRLAVGHETDDSSPA